MRRRSSLKQRATRTASRALEAKLDVAMRRLRPATTWRRRPRRPWPSYKCVATGKLFPTMAADQAYAARTGRTDFEESTEECVPEPPPPEDAEVDELYK